MCQPLQCWILLFLLSGYQACNPEITVDADELYGETQTNVVCTVPAVCSANKVLWEKEYNGQWIPVYEADSGSRPLETEVGYSLENRETGLSIGIQHILTITRTIPQDSGQWQCKILTDSGDYETSGKEVRIISNITSSYINIIRNEKTAIKQPEKYGCESTLPVYPDFDVIWEAEGKNYTNGTNNNSQSGFIWNIANEIVLTLFNEDDNMPVTCYFVKTSGLPMQAGKESTASPCQLPVSSPFPWWAIMLIVIGLLISIGGAVGGGVVYSQSKSNFPWWAIFLIIIGLLLSIGGGIGGGVVHSQSNDPGDCS